MLLFKARSGQKVRTSMLSSVKNEITFWRLAAAIVAAVSVYGATNTPFDLSASDARNAIGIVVGSSATILGFLVSAGALLYAVSNTQLARNLQRTGHFRKLLKDLFVSASAFLLSSIWGTYCLFFAGFPSDRGFGICMSTAIYVLLFISVLSYLLLLPLGWKMWILLSNLKPENPSILE